MARSQGDFGVARIDLTASKDTPCLPVKSVIDTLLFRHHSVELLRLICRDRQLDQEFARGFSQVRDSFPEFCDTFGDLGLPGGHNPHRKSVME